MTDFVSTVYQNFLVRVAPGICRQCGDHHRPGDELSDGKPYACGLMVEAMDAGCTVGSCAHFRFGPIAPALSVDDIEALEDIIREDRADRIRADKENAEPILDAETLQAATGIQQRAAAIQDTMFADEKPFDPEHCVRDRVGS